MSRGWLTHRHLATLHRCQYYPTQLPQRVGPNPILLDPTPFRLVRWLIATIQLYIGHGYHPGLVLMCQHLHGTVSCSGMHIPNKHCPPNLVIKKIVGCLLNFFLDCFSNQDNMCIAPLHWITRHCHLALHLVAKQSNSRSQSGSKSCAR